MRIAGAGKAKRFVGVYAVTALLAAALTVWADGNIDGSAEYAWAENAGWNNYGPTHGGVTVVDNGANSYLEGYAWAENIGWIRLGAGSGPYLNTQADNYGVNMDVSGNLSGYAWSEVAGWINFNPTHNQVTVNTSTGSFDGYAWGENIGWVHFKNTSPAYNVRTIIFDGAPPPRGTMFRFR